MKKTSICIGVAIFLLFFAATSQALSLKFSPMSQEVVVLNQTGQGGTAEVDLMVSDLGEDNLGAFDIYIGLHMADVLSFNENGSTIGDPLEGDQLNFSGLDLVGFGFAGFETIWTTPTFTRIRVFEVSLDPIDELQEKQESDSFVLATLQFDTLRFGTSFLTIDPFDSVLGDAFGESLDFTVETIGSGPFPQASARIDVVPEPSTVLLLGVGLWGFVAVRLKSRRS
jgi:hypothetical protein